MTSYGFDEPADLKAGDLVYRYMTTGLFASTIRLELSAQAQAEMPPDTTLMQFVQEDVAVTVVAEIHASTFTARWLLGSNHTAEHTNEHGTVIKNPSIAYMLFQGLRQYGYLG